MNEINKKRQERGNKNKTIEFGRSSGNWHVGRANYAKSHGGWLLSTLRGIFTMALVRECAFIVTELLHLYEKEV